MSAGAGALLQDEVAALVVELRQRAALLGRFDPLALVAGAETRLGGGEEGARLADQALNRLSREIDEVVSESGTFWRLNADARRVGLADLVATGNLRKMLASVPADLEDRFGTFLRRSLAGKSQRGEPRGLSTLDPDGLMDWALARDFAEGALGRPAHKGARTPRLVLARRAEEARLDHVAPRRRFFGREAASAAMLAYAREGSFLPPLKQLGRDRQDATFVRPALVTGIGGSGKSALVANLVRSVKGRNWSGPVVVTLDFDRLSLALGAEREWLAEVTRQIARARPALAERLSEVRLAGRRTLDDYLREVGSMERLSSTHLLNVVMVMRHKLKEVLGQSGLANEPLIVIVDTFEEVLVRSDMSLDDAALDREPYGLILSFLDSLDDLGGPSGSLFGSTRAIVAGRAHPFLGDDARLGRWFNAHFEVGELEPAAAARLLRDRVGAQLAWGRARKIAKAVPRYPIVLILVASFLAGGDGARLDELLAEGGLGDLNAEAATQVLYKRFLERLRTYEEPDGKGGIIRIPQEELSRLAQPGLALPFVTPELIRLVLAGPCGLGEVDQHRAGVLFRALSRAVWLVEAAGQQCVRHVPALRRIMLPMLATDVTVDADGRAIKDRLLAVHAAAARWYREGGATAPDAAQFAAYHDCFRGNVSAIAEDATLRRRVLDLAGDDVSSMPREARALLIRERGTSSALSTDEAAALPEEQRLRAKRERRSARSKRGIVESQRPQSAASDPASPSIALPGLAAPKGFQAILDDREIALAIEADFAAADFAAVCALAGPAVLSLAEAKATPNPAPLQISRDPTSHWLWKWALSALATQSGTDEVEAWGRAADEFPAETDGDSLVARPILALAIGTVALGRAPDFLKRPPYLDFIARLGAPDRANLPVVRHYEARLRLLMPLWTGRKPSVPPPFKLSVEVARLVALSDRLEASPTVSPQRQGLADWIGPRTLFEPPQPWIRAFMAPASEPGGGGASTLAAAELDALLRIAELGEAFRLPPVVSFSQGHYTLPVHAPVGDPLTDQFLPAYGLLLRGLSPELYDPVRTVLVDVVRASPAMLVNAVQLWQGRAMHWPSDLGKEAVEARIIKSRSADFALAQLIGALDANGLLLAFLETCREALPSETRLEAVTNLLLAYDRVLLEYFGAFGLMPQTGSKVQQVSPSPHMNT